MTRVFVAPRRTRKSFWVVSLSLKDVTSFLERVFPIIAACPLPSPGRRLSNGEATKEPKNAFARGLFISFNVGF